MARIHAYLNFNGNCEEAFQFYETVFNTNNNGIFRYRDMPADSNMPILSELDKNKIMHVSLYLNEDTMLMGADVIEDFGGKIIPGNSTYIMLYVESETEANMLFDSLAKDAQKIEMPLEGTFFAELFASFQDKFGIYWMIHFEGIKKMTE